MILKVTQRLVPRNEQKRYRIVCDGGNLSTDELQDGLQKINRASFFPMVDHVLSNLLERTKQSPFQKSKLSVEFVID